MTKKDLFNQDSICIFTDASFKKYDPKSTNSIGITAPAYCVYNEDTCIEQGFHILHNSTSQQGELYAMLLGVNVAFKYRSFPHIRIFADNQNAVFSIRDWIFNWVRDTNYGKPVLGYEGRINNQEYIMSIIYSIISNNIPIELYHVKGHVNIRSHSDIEHSRRLFKTSNPCIDFADDSLIFQLAMGNNQVDEYSTVMLRSYYSDPKYDTRNLTPGFTVGYSKFDLVNYMNLVNKNGK